MSLMFRSLVSTRLASCLLWPLLARPSPLRFPRRVGATRALPPPFSLSQSSKGWWDHKIRELSRQYFISTLANGGRPRGKARSDMSGVETGFDYHATAQVVQKGPSASMSAYQLGCLRGVLAGAIRTNAGSRGLYKLGKACSQNCEFCPDSLGTVPEFYWRCPGPVTPQCPQGLYRAIRESLLTDQELERIQALPASATHCLVFPK